MFSFFFLSAQESSISFESLVPFRRTNIFLYKKLVSLTFPPFFIVCARA